MATGKRKAYDPAFKVRVVEFAEANTQAAAARKFVVTENHEAVQVEPGGSGSGCLELEENCLAKI